FQVGKRSGRTGSGQPGTHRADAQRQQQSAVLVWSSPEQLQHGAVACRFTRQQILARCEDREWMEEEQALAECRYTTQPQISTPQVHDLVADGHPALGTS